MNHIIAKFFPLNLSYELDVEEYHKSEEFQRLDKITTALHKNTQFWERRFQRLNQKIDTSFRLLMPNHLDRCLSFQMRLDQNSNDSCINIDISALGPLYSVFILEKSLTGLPTDEPLNIGKNLIEEFVANTNYTKSAEFETHRVESLIRSIRSFIEVNWKLSELPFDQFEDRLEGFSFEQKGDLLTVYEAIFTSNHLIL